MKQTLDAISDISFTLHFSKTPKVLILKEARITVTKDEETRHIPKLSSLRKDTLIGLIAWAIDNVEETPELEEWLLEPSKKHTKK